MRFAPLLLALVLVGCAASPTAPSSGSTGSAAALVDIGAGIQGPAGLAATVVATGLMNVAALAIDDQARIWAATAAFDDAGTDTISVVTTPGSTPKTVVRGLHTVLGLLWIDDALFVASKERVTVYRGFDGSTFASEATIVTFAAGVGEVNALALGPDGRLTLGISAPCNACMPTMADSASVLSFRPDGTDVRIVATGIRAPVGLAYVPGTSDLLVTMNQRDDLGDATPGDLLALVSAGQDWGFPSCYGQADASCADLPDPVAVLDTHAAASGVAVVTGGLAAGDGTAAIVAEWAKGRVVRVALTRTATGYRGTALPFLTGIANPVAVLADGSGSVFVGDWSTGRVIRVVSAG